MSDETGNWPKWSTILKAAAIVVAAVAVVAVVAVTVSTFGAGSVAGVAVITAALSIGAKTTEVAVLQAKKSTTKPESTGSRSSSSSGGGSSGNNADVGSEEKSGGQVVADVIDAVFDNGIKILTPGATKALTTGLAFARDDLFNNPVLNSDFKRFITRSAKPLGMLTAYGFAAYAWVQTTISIFCDDPEQRAMDRGYRLK